MRPIERGEILDFETYEDEREEIRLEVMRKKAERRVHVGDHLTFLFENRDTIRYQVQEMVRVERLVRESDIEHEIGTYNELLGGPGELGCTLLIEIERKEDRQVLLAEWIDLPKHLFLRLEDGSRVPATYDERQVGVDRLSSVQYLKFDTKGAVPVAVGTDVHVLEGETRLSTAQREALARDLAE